MHNFSDFFKDGYAKFPREKPAWLKEAPPCARELFWWLMENVNWGYKDGLAPGEVITSYNTILKDLSWKCGRGRQSYSANDLKKAFILFREKGVVKTNYKQTKTKSEYKITFLIYGFLQDKEKYKKKDCRTWVGAEDEQMAYNTHAEESIYEPVSIAVSEDEHYSRTRVDAEDGNNDRCFTRLRGDWRTQNGIGEPGSHTQDSINGAPFGGSKSDWGTDSYIAPDSEHGTYMYSNNKSIVPRQESDENIPHMTDEERDEILKEHEDWKLSLDDQIGVDDDTPF